MARLRDLTSLFAGRWQVPVTVLAIVAVALALSRTRPPPRQVDFASLLADIVALTEGKAYIDAANSAQNLIEMKPPLAPLQQAVLHEQLADIIFRVESLREVPNSENLRKLLDHQADAARLGVTPDAQAALRAGQAHEWLLETQDAVESYRAALDRLPDAEGRRTALQALVRLLDGRPESEQERRGWLDALLEEEGVSPAYVWWALQHAVQQALDQNDIERAYALLQQHAGRFERSDLLGYHRYLWAWVDISDGRYEEAQPLVDWIDEWLRDNTLVDMEMHKAGFLPALNLWLRGRLELADARPQQALATFDDALARQTGGNLSGLLTIGRSQCLAALERHEAARKAMRDVFAGMARDPACLTLTMTRLRKVALELYADRHERDDFDNAIAYLELALDLTPQVEAVSRLDLLERLGRERDGAAQQCDDKQRQRDLAAAAGHNYEQAADLARLDEARQGTLLWWSGQAFDKAGASTDARRTLKRFVEGRVTDPRLPPALLQLGQSCAADGLPDEALRWYARLIDMYPLLEEASRARLMTAETLRSIGGPQAAQAEAILVGLLEDERIAPQAQVFHDALLALCNLLYDEGRLADAISRIENFFTFYPEDPDRGAASFMLADAYRRSGHALREKPPQGASPEDAREEGATRLRKAAQLFDQYQRDVTDGAATDETLAAYERLAVFHRAECLCALNTPAALEEALALYRQAAVRYQAQPAALNAQVQIANILLRQGKAVEAARAVERARWLLRGMPDSAFQPADGLDRGQWDRYLTTVASSSLMRDVFETPN